MLNVFIDGVNQAFNFFLDIVSKVWILYTTAPVLMAVLALWVVRKVVNLFGLLKG